LVGVLEIKGEEVVRDLRRDAEIEVTLKIDESRIITVTAYVPELDQEFSATLIMQRHSRDMDSLREEYEAELGRFKEIRAKAGIADGTAAEKLIQAAEASPEMVEVRELLSRNGDPDAADRCERRLLELKIQLDKAANELQWPSLVAEARECIGALTELAKEQGKAELHKRVAELSAEIEKVIGRKATEDLGHKIKQAWALWFEVVATQASFWVYQHQQLEKRLEEMSDKPRAERLLGQGRAFISQNNATGLQNVVRELWNLLPDQIQEGINRGYQAGVVRGR
jgi:molecular chaperone DnaK